MKFVNEFISWTAHIIIGMFVAVLINLFIFQPVYVSGDSMESTLSDGDKVFISKIVHTFNTELEYGDIVVIDSKINMKRTLKDDLVQSFTNNVITNKLFNKEEDDSYWIKRVIGKAGDIIEFKDNKVFRNSIEIVEEYVDGTQKYSNTKIEIAENHLFVMGDNRGKSLDSRIIGSIPEGHVIGKFKFKF